MVFKSLIIIVFFANISKAQNSPDTERKLWALETELIQPFIPTVHIVRFQAVRNVSKNGDLLLGVYIRPNVKHDVVEKINEYMAFAGYRHYFWKGLHLEAKANVGYAWGTKNLIDGKDYETFTIFYESNLGYKINISKTKNSLYILPQFGVLGNAKGQNTLNIGPRGGKPDVFIQGNLIIGLNI